MRISGSKINKRLLACIFVSSACVPHFFTSHVRLSQQRRALVCTNVRKMYDTNEPEMNKYFFYPTRGVCLPKHLFRSYFWDAVIIKNAQFDFTKLFSRQNTKKSLCIRQSKLLRSNRFSNKGCAECQGDTLLFRLIDAVYEIHTMAHNSFFLSTGKEMARCVPLFLRTHTNS